MKASSSCAALAALENHVEAQQVEAEALVGLFRALGGGWPLKDNLPDIPRPQVAAALKYLTTAAAIR
jgi:hypothetical protein